MDKLYKPGTSTEKRCTEGEGDAPSVITPECDISYEAVEQFLARLKELYPNPDFILYTGDTSPHYLDFGYATPYTQEDIYTVMEEGLEMMSAAFPGVPLYPIHGNHDNFPCDVLPLDNRGAEHIARMGELFRDYIPSDSVETFKKYGYYTADIDDKLRILATTSDYWLHSNIYAQMTGGEDDKGLLDHVEAELKKMREEHKIGLWIGHQPFGHSETSYGEIPILPIPWHRIERLLREYGDVISFGLYNGHTHKNSFKVIVDENMKPLTSQFTTTALGDYSDQNGGCNVFMFDTDTYKLVDLFMVYIDTDESNRVGEIVLDVFPSFVTDMGLDDLSPESLIELFKKNIVSKDAATFLNYVERVYTGMQPSAISNQTWGAMACSAGPLDEDTYQACYASLSKGKPYVYNG